MAVIQMIPYEEIISNNNNKGLMTRVATDQDEMIKKKYY